MSILRTEKIGNDPHFSSCYDLLVDDVADLAEFPAAGVGSMAYVRAASAVYVKTASGWEALSGSDSGSGGDSSDVQGDATE